MPKPKSHTPCPPEFQQRMEMVRTRRSPDELAEKVEPTAQSTRNWVAQAERATGRRSDGLTTEQRDEVRRLRRENKTRREAREILRNSAAACGARSARNGRPAGSFPTRYD
jgi:transposase